MFPLMPVSGEGTGPWYADLATETTGITLIFEDQKEVGYTGKKQSTPAEERGAL